MPVPPELRPTLPSWAKVSEGRLRHIERVARLTFDWAGRMGVPEAESARWLKAVWLHDALRDASEEELAIWAPSAPAAPGLRHGPAAAGRAKAEGETDRGVLDAVRYHSVGLAEWDMVGRVLYCADFLEPGRLYDQDTRSALAERFPSDPSGVLLEVARWRIGHLIQSGWSLPEPTSRFWNRLVRGGPGGSR
jgi:HD superfamily phosphohydrolase YqeK